MLRLGLGLHDPMESEARSRRNMRTSTAKAKEDYLRNPAGVHAAGEGPLYALDRRRDTMALTAFKIGVPTGIRTPVLTVKGWCPRPLDDGDAA